MLMLNGASFQILYSVVLINLLRFETTLVWQKWCNIRLSDILTTTTNEFGISTATYYFFQSKKLNNEIEKTSLKDREVLSYSITEL